MIALICLICDLLIYFGGLRVIYFGGLRPRDPLGMTVCLSYLFGP